MLEDTATTRLPVGKIGVAVLLYVTVLTLLTHWVLR